MKKTLKQSWTVYSSGAGIAGIIAAISMGSLDPLVGGIAIAFAVAVIFLRRAVGDSTVEVGHMLVEQIVKAVEKESDGAGFITTKKVKQILEAVDPAWNPPFSEGGK